MGIPLVTASLVAGGRMVVVCAGGLAFEGLLSEREIAYLLRHLRLPSFSFAILAAYRSVPMAFRISREVQWGLTARGLSANRLKPRTWLTGSIRLVSAFIIASLEQADVLATAIELRGLRVPGRFLARPVAVSKSVALVVLALVNIGILIGQIE